MSDEIIEQYRTLGMPEWIITAVSIYAYNVGHAYGQSEVDYIADEILYELQNQKAKLTNG